ncbi:ABC transporter substrate-binding protein [Mycobacterium sp. NAZ190054]|uniref:ABC transporter substrate-binding protein n=1 Tax=Mycobacterium sp. NAZ190054 TaxID=1747766 RepID=UPI00079785B9|nr:extracellular solute-binding protein [Mycobacterium sp. NAZ190054]KWX65845.1 hypothetical protein ASJ79_07295 [Mycobacterium sp. NAZ190054]
MTRSKFLTRVPPAVMALLVAMSLVSACGQASDDGGEIEVNPDVNAENWTLAEAAKPFAGTEIRVLDELTDLQPSLATMIPEFEAETGITVTYELEGHTDVIRKGESDMLSGRSAYDAVMVHVQQAGRVVSADAVEFLDPYLDNESLHDPSVSFDDMVQPLADQATMFDGQRLAFPNWNYNVVWWGREDLMEHPEERQAFQARYGRELAPPTTLQELRDYAEFFTRSRGETLAGRVLDGDFPGFVTEGAQGGGVADIVEMVFLNQFGGGIFAEDGSPAADRPENVEAMQFYGDLWDFGPAGQAELGLIDMPVMMGNGRAASGFIYSDFAFNVDKEGASPFAGQIVYAPTPGNGSTHVTSVQPGMLMISKASQNKEATFLFLQWIASKSTQDKWMETGVAMPVRADSFESAAVTSGPRQNLYTAVSETFEFGRAWPNNAPQLYEIFDAVARMQQRVGTGDSAPQDALADLQSEMESICGGSCLVGGVS